MPGPSAASAGAHRPEPGAPHEPARGCDVVVFHSVLGLRPGVRRWADRLRAAGHRVHVPDLYDGAVFDAIPAGMEYLERLGGIPALIARGQAAVAHLPREIVYAGFSNGAALAELLAATRPGARGAILMHGALPVAALGTTAWPASVPVQVHYMSGDPYRNPALVEGFAADVRRAGATLEQYDYPGTGHLFADPDLPDHDPGAAALMLERVLDALARMGNPSPGASPPAPPPEP